MIRVLVLIGVLFVAPASAAEELAKPETIRALLDATQARKLLDTMRSQVDGQFDAGMKAALGETKLTANQQKIVTDARAKFLAIATEQLDWSRFEPMMIDIYSETFTEQEVQGALQFYRSPAGQAVVLKMPQVAQNTMRRVQSLMAETAPRLKQAADDMLRQIQQDAAAQSTTPDTAPAATPAKKP
jgi:hypothetical protein